MATPNMINVSSMYGKTVFYTPTANANTVVLANAPSSNKVYKINNIIASNIDGANSINATISVYSNGAITQGNTASGGSIYPLVYLVAVPAGASLTLLDKSVYLEEDRSIVVTSGTANKINYTVSYEEIA